MSLHAEAARTWSFARAQCILVAGKPTRLQDPSALALASSAAEPLVGTARLSRRNFGLSLLFLHGRFGPQLFDPDTGRQYLKFALFHVRVAPDPLGPNPLTVHALLRALGSRVLTGSLTGGRSAGYGSLQNGESMRGDSTARPSGPAPGPLVHLGRELGP